MLAREEVAVAGQEAVRKQKQLAMGSWQEERVAVAVAVGRKKSEAGISGEL